MVTRLTVTRMIIAATGPLVAPAALAGMLAVAGLALGRVYAGDLAPGLLIGAGIGSVAVSVATRRLPSWAVGPVSVLMLAGYTLLAVRLTAAGGGIDGPLARLTGDALRNGIPRVLTAMIPIEAQPDTVAVPVIATWLTGLAGAELALRARRMLLACLAPTLLYAVVLYAVGPNADATLWQPLSFAGLVAIALTVGTDRPDETPVVLTRVQGAALRARVAAGAAATLALTIGLVAAVGPAVVAGVSRQPADPRRYITPPQLDALDENPLVRLSGWALNPGQHLFDIRLSGAPRPDTRVRLAVLNDYDGVTWRAGATYRTAGRVLGRPAGDADDRAGPVSQQITIAELDGKLVPAAAVPERIDGARVAFDQVTGTVAIPDGLRSGLRYTVVSRAPTVDVNLLPSAGVASGPAIARYVRLGSPAPIDIQQLAERLAEGNATPFSRAQAIELFLSEHYQLTTDAPSGHAYPNLSFFLFGPRAGGGGQRGTSEQFAAAFAVLARLAGLPTRIIVGFRAGPGAVTIRGADALAWPEVLFDRVGWVPFNPLPQPDTQPRPVEEDFTPPPTPSNPPPSSQPPRSAPPTSAAPSRSANAAGAGDGTPPGTVAAETTTGLLLLLGIGVATVVLLRRARRRRRLYLGEPPGRVLGAWLEVLDALRLAGRPPPHHLAVTEIAELAARTALNAPIQPANTPIQPANTPIQPANAPIRAADGPNRAGDSPIRAADDPIRPAVPRIDELAGLVNLVAFTPDGASAAQADQAAAQAAAYVNGLRAGRPWWRRWLWSADPRPLRWAHRRR
jgi:transglutaminase-like putative cysteine protease